METGDNKRWLPGFIALGVIWGSSFLFIKVGLKSLTPVGVAFWRGVFGGITLLFLCVISKTGLPLAYSSTALAAAQVTCSVLILSPIAFFSGTNHGPWTTKSLMAMLILGALGTGVAYILNFSNVKLAGSAIASTVTYITPVVATILGIGFLGETFKFSHLLGGILVLISAALVQGRIKILSRR